MPFMTKFASNQVKSTHEFNTSIPTTEIASAGRKATSRKDTWNINNTGDHNPFRVPADLEQARLHGEAKKVFYHTIKADDPRTAGRMATYKISPDVPETAQVCPCCDFQVGQKIPLRTHLIELSHLGTGYPLYFRFFKYSIGALLLILSLSGMYNIISNVKEGDCKLVQEEVTDETAETYCIEGYNMSFALSNKKDNQGLLTAQIALNLVTVIAIIVFFQIMRYRFRKMKIAADEKTIRPSDYTVQLQNVPLEAKKSDIRAWIHNTFPGENLEIVRILRTHAIGEYIKLINTSSELRVKKAQLNYMAGKLSEKEKAQEKIITEKLAKTENRIEQIQKYRLLKQVPIVFVTFSTTQDAEIVRRFQKSWVDIAIEIFRPPKDHACYKWDDNRTIKIRRAPEPRDILWENLEFCNREKAPTKLFSYLMTSLVIFTCFGVVLLINWAQGKAVQEFGRESNIIQALSILASICVFLTNEVLAILAKTIARYEKRRIYSHFLRAIAKRLAIAQFLNSGLTNFFAQIILADDHGNFSDRVQNINYYGKGGLLENMYWIFVTNAFLTPLVTIFDPIYLWKRFKIFLMERKEEKEIRNKLTQIQANELYEGPNMDLPKRYAMVIKFVLLAAFYCPAIPFALIYTVIGLGLWYWANKYMLLRKMVSPTPINTDLTDTMVSYLEGAKGAFAVGNLLYVYTLKNKADELAFTNKGLIWITLIIGLLHFFLPMSFINEKLFKTEKKTNKVQVFQKARLDFFTDYDIENPVTHEKAANELKALKLKSNSNRRTRKISDFLYSPPTIDSPTEYSNMLSIGKQERKESANEDEGEVDFGFLKVYAARIHGSQFTTPAKRSSLYFGTLPRAISKFKRRISEKRATSSNEGNLSVSSVRQDRSHSPMIGTSHFKPIQGFSNQAMEDILKAREEQEEMNKEEHQNGEEQENENEQGQAQENEEEQQEQEQENNIEKTEIQNHIKFPTESEPESVKDKKRMKLDDVLYHLGIDVSPETDQEETEFRD